MKDDHLRSEIDIAKIPADANAGGLIFAIATMAVFLIGIPAIRFLFPVALFAGSAIAVVLHFLRHGLHGSTPRHF
jgi:hypothetical protein